MPSWLSTRSSQTPAGWRSSRHWPPRAGGRAVEFVRLRERTRLTDGNLACHAKRLQSAGLVAVDKRFRDGKPVTSFVLTPAGRAAMEDHVERLLAAVRVATIGRIGSCTP